MISETEFVNMRPVKGLCEHGERLHTGEKWRGKRKRQTAEERGRLRAVKNREKRDRAESQRQQAYKDRDRR